MDYTGRIITKNPQTPSANGAPGIWTLDEAMQYSKQGKWPPGYQISRSVRLRSSASAYFNRTPASAGNRQTWTWSGWVKRGVLGSQCDLFCGDSSTTISEINIGSDDTLKFWQSGTTLARQSTAVYRDPSAWYHIVVVLDTTNATAQNRCRMYVNGVEITTWTTNNTITQNSQFGINTATAHNLGRSTAASIYFDGYLTEINFIDGQALTPASFGYTDTATGVWQPAPYNGTYGTNGFYLNFKDATSTTTIGYDYSGNSNNFTANNISVTAGSTYDSMVDVPINWGTDTGAGGLVRGNYATFSAVDYFGSPGLSEANLTISGTNPGDFGTIKLTSGKWYFEFRKNADGDNQLGIASGNAYQSSGNLGTTCFRRTWRDNVGTPSWLTDSGTPGSGTAQSLATGDILGVALDLDNNAVYFAKNNTWMNSGVPTSGSSKTGAIWTDLSGGTWQIYAGGNSNGCYTTLNAGQRPFTYTAPSGFKVFCTQNLSVPTILNGANYMAATLYTGNGGTLAISNAVNSISFQPDLVWMKSRSAATNHALYDSVRGVTKDIASNTTAVETTETTGLTAFGTTGFTIGALASINTNAATYVGWQWKGGGTAVTNTAGSITSSVSANTTAGFSVVTWTATGANATVGHGLGVSPSMIILKPRSQSDQWPTWINTFAVNEYVYVNLTNAKASLSTFMNGTLPSSSVVSLGTWSSVGTNNVTMVMYCFAAISGYSAFGSYTGNGSTDGPFVYCGFRPRFVLVKDTTNVTYWEIGDSSRNTYNAVDANLYPNSAFAEAADPMFDFLSNGFKVKKAGGNFNNSGAATIYAAFAENPFTLARAR